MLSLWANWLVTKFGLNSLKRYLHMYDLYCTSSIVIFAILQLVKYFCIYSWFWVMINWFCMPLRLIYSYCRIIKSSSNHLLKSSALLCSFLVNFHVVFHSFHTLDHCFEKIDLKFICKNIILEYLACMERRKCIKERKKFVFKICPPPKKKIPTL